MKKLTARIFIAAFMAGCIASTTNFLVIGGAGAEVPRQVDAVGTWIGFGPQPGVFFRLDLDRDGTGYFTTAFEHSRSKEKPDVYRVLNWKSTIGLLSAKVAFGKIDINVAPSDTNAAPIKFKKVEFYAGQEAKSENVRWLDCHIFHGGSDSPDNAEWEIRDLRLVSEREWRADAERAEKAIERERKKRK
jgi:hypothetical protein